MEAQFTEAVETLRAGLPLARTHPVALGLLELLSREPQCASAVWHPLGFLCLELHRCKTWSLRVHVWSSLPGDYRGADLDIHCHDWDLTSYIVCGRIVHELFAVGPGAPTHAAYDIEYDGQINRLRRQRYVRCMPGVRETLRAPRYYQLPAGVFHRATCELNTVNATLVLARRRHDVRNEVLGPKDGSSVYTTARTKCLAEDVRRAADLVLARAAS